MKKIFLSLFISSIFTLGVIAQSHNSTQAHQEQITNIKCVPNVVGNENAYVTSGEDGFIIKWSDDNQGEHYQITDVGIKLIAYSPNGNDIAVYESDGGSVNKVSVWNWKTLTRKYQKKFNESITSLSFSAKGTYLIIGTATVDGAIFVKTDNWQIVDKIKANTGIVSYINTSETEKTCVFYSPSGTLSYYSLANGQLKQKFNIVSGLTNVVMFNKNIYLAGIKDNTIYIINAYKGNIVSSVKVQNPIILSTEKDYNLYYLEYDGKNAYTVSMLESKEDQTISNPRIVKNLRGPRGNGAICVGTKNFTDIYLGSKNGSIYRTEAEPTVNTDILEELTENPYSKIYDMAESSDAFYFLTDTAIYESSYDTGKVKYLSATEGQTQIINTGDNQVVLWYKGLRYAVKLVDFNDNTSKEIFTPKNNINTLKLCTIHNKKYLVEIESNTSVNLYDFETNNFKHIYSGTGVQDAILTNNGLMYIAKTASTNPNVPLISVNIETLETVPVNMKGNVSYGLSTNGNTIYGINLISDDTGRNTYVFSYNTTNNQITNILKFSDEDSEAFTYLSGTNLFTNIGKNKIYCYNLTSKKRFSYNRSASIPVDICQKNNRVVILNSDGSISWASSTGSNLLADWYLTIDQTWYEF